MNKKRKKERAVIGERSPEVPTFDQAKALRDEKTERKDEERWEEPFDPMRKLRLDWNDKGIGKKPYREAMEEPR